MIQLKQAKSNVNIQYPGFEGEAGGYYIPSVDEEGLLTWTPSKEGMKEAENALIVGAPGESGVYVGDEAPTSANVWIDTNSSLDEELATKQYVDDAISSIDGADMSSYYTKTEVDALIPDTSAFQTEDEVNALITLSLEEVENGTY